MFQVAATANGVTYTGTVPSPKPTSSGSQSSSGTSSGTGNGSPGGVISGFGATTLLAVICVILGAFSVFI